MALSNGHTGSPGKSRIFGGKGNPRVLKPRVTSTLTCLIQGEALIKGEGGQIVLKQGGEERKPDFGSFQGSEYH